MRRVPDADEAGPVTRARRADPSPTGFDPEAVVRRAVAGVEGSDPALLDGFLDSLANASRESRRLRRHEIDRHRAAGAAAAERGVPLRVVVDLHLRAMSMAWTLLPRPSGVGPDDTAMTVLRAASDVVAAVTVGYEAGQRATIRNEEAGRREFVDDLLHGSVDPTRLPDLATRYGLPVAAAFVVSVAESPRPFTDADERTRLVESAVRSRTGARAALVATKDGRLVCVASSADSTAGVFADRVQALSPTAVRVGVGRPRSGPSAAALSYRDARDALVTAERLDLAGPVLHARDLLVYQVLFRDRDAISELVTTVLDPLTRARGGAGPLLDTLTAFFDTGSAAAAARQLHIGIRTVTYRLGRVRQLTGYGVTDPTERYTLRTAVLGARLLRWPDTPRDE